MIRIKTQKVQVLGHKGTLAYEPWPQHDEELLVEDTVNLPIQVLLGRQTDFFSWYIQYMENGMHGILSEFA